MDILNSLKWSCRPGISLHKHAVVCRIMRAVGCFAPLIFVFCFRMGGKRVAKWFYGMFLF